ncbi:MAG: zinc-ribbon domain-containing protein, partial [Nitrososphaeraceae archaeon]
MKFCTECGSQLPIGTAKFCPNCGQKLWTTKLEEGTIPLSSSKLKSNDDKQTVFSTKPEEGGESNYSKQHSYTQEERIDNAVSSIHSLGV